MRVFILILFLHPLWIYAQSNYKEVEILNQLSQSTILSIHEDKYGFMWFGTADGLNRFDGTNVKVFRNIPGDENCVCGNEVMALATDNDGNLWIGTSKCLTKLNLDNYQFSHISHIDSDENSLSNNYVSSLLFDGKYIWAGTLNGLNRIDPKTNDVKQYFKGNSRQRGTQVVSDIAFRKGGSCWVSFADDICLYDEQLDKLVALKDQFDNPDLLNKGKISNIEQCNGELIAALENCIVSINLKENKLKPIVDNIITTVRVIKQTPSGDVFIGSSEGLIKFNDQKNLIEYGVNSVPLNEIVYDIFVDSREDIWISLGTGIVKAPSDNHPIKSIKISDHTPAYGGQNKVWHLCDEGKSIIISTEKGTYALISDNRIMPFFSKDEFVDIPENVSNVIRTSDNLVWFNTFDKGVYQFDKSTRKLKHFVHNPNDSFSITNNTVRHAIQRKNGQIYFATDNGISIYNKEKNSFLRIMDEIPKKTVLNRMTTFLHEDDNENLWIGTQAGIYYYDTQEKIYSHYSTTSTPNISNDYIRVIHQSSDSILWIGTSAGLNKLNIPNNTITKYYSQEGLPNDVIYSIEEDLEGDLWMGTNKGISAFIRDSFFINFNKYDGLQDNEFNTNASLEDSNGYMYFGGLKGINKFDPIQLKRFSPKNTPFITRLEIIPHDNSNGSVYNFPLKEKYNLSFLECNFIISFSSINFENPENTQYYYILEGYNHEWIKTTGDSKVQFMNLKPGDYTFKVSIADNRGELTDQIASIDIYIVPPYYMTLWFKLLLSGFIIMAIIALTYWRFAQIQASNKKLNRLVEEQTKEIKSANSLSKSYLESIPDPLMVVDKQLNIEYANKLLLKTVKHFIDQLDLKNLRDFPAEDKMSPFVSKMIEHIERIFKNKIESEFEDLIVCKKNKDYYYSIKCKPVIGKSGQIEKAVVQFRDITKNKLAEQSIRQNEALFRSYFQKSPIGIIYVLNPSKPITNCNPQFANMLGYTKKEILTKTMTGLTHPKDLENDILVFKEALKKKKKYLFLPQKRLQHKDGSVVITETHLTFIYNDEQELEYIFALVSDITQKLLDQRKLEETRNQLIQSDKMASLGHLTAGIAHEINNPVNFISNGVKGLKKTLNEYIENPNTTEAKELINDMHDMISAIKDGSKRTTNIVKSLRQFSREDTEHYVEADIITGLESTITLLFNKLKHGIFLEREYDSESVILYCYPGQLNQVFMNVLLNAIQAIEQTGTIRIVVKEDDTNIIVKIIDNGVGIPDNIKAKVFEPFFTTKGVIDGTGLGLSISFGIVKKHKGEIEISDNTPKGTQVIITLPKVVNNLKD